MPVLTVGHVFWDHLGSLLYLEGLVSSRASFSLLVSCNSSRVYVLFVENDCPCRWLSISHFFGKKVGGYQFPINFPFFWVRRFVILVIIEQNNLSFTSSSLDHIYDSNMIPPIPFREALIVQQLEKPTEENGGGEHLWVVTWI